MDRAKIHELVNKKLENYANEEKNFKTYSWDAPSYAEITDFVLDQAQETIQSIREENQALREALEKADECMRCARQSAFESVYRELLYQGTVRIVDVLNRYAKGDKNG